MQCSAEFLRGGMRGRLWAIHRSRTLLHPPSTTPPTTVTLCQRQCVRWYYECTVFGRQPMSKLGGIWQPNIVSWQEWQIILDPVTVRKQGYAKATAVPPQYQRTVGMKLYMGSPGILFEPYRPPPPPLPFLQRWFTKEGWKRRKEWILKELKTGYTIARLHKTGYNRAKFYNEACEIFKKINGALAQGDRTTLRQLVTENMFSLFKKEIKQREGVWDRVLWQCDGPLKKIQTLQGRLAAADKKNLENAIVQLTVRIHSSQIFAAYDRQGKLVAGDPIKEILVEDIWVFEKLLNQSDARWKLCGRISP